MHIAGQWFTYMIFKRFKKYDDDTSGAAAIEFSLLALPFVFTCVCIIELGLYFGSAFLMEAAVIDASRLIKTGQVQEADSGDQEEMFADALCEIAGIIMDCDAMQYEVRKLDSFTDDMDAAYNEDGDLDEPEFQAGNITAGCVGLIRVAYRYEFITPLFGRFFGNQGNTRLLLATTVFRTEPYDYVEAANCSI